MENTEFKSATDQLRTKVLQRVVLLTFGCITSCLALMIIPLLYVMPLKGEMDAPVPVQITSAGPADVMAQPIPITPEPFPIAALIPPIILLVLFCLIAYGVYDGISLFMRYRKSKEMDELMFP
jgi:hypothetical protein